MSFFNGQALQKGLYDAMVADPEIVSLADIYDAPPVLGPGTLDRDYVTLGEERIRSVGRPGEEIMFHDVSVTVHSAAQGFARAKEIARLVCDRLLGAPPALPELRVVDLRFVRARAERGRAVERRRIRLDFRVVLEAEPAAAP